MLQPGFGHPAQALAACPARSDSIPVVSWLLNHIDSVTVHRFRWPSGGLTEEPGYPKVVNDPTVLNNLLHLTGSYVPWNGYDSNTTFGDFYYPTSGSWYDEYELHADGTVYPLWIGRSELHNTRNVLAFLFRDMQANADANGQHMGNHHFCMASVPLVKLGQLDLMMSGVAPTSPNAQSAEAASE